MTKSSPFKYIYGPVPSWRLGRSLGIDPLSQEDKVCSYDCSYCQIGRTRVFSTERKVYVPTEAVLKELNSIPPIEVDYYTFSGRGEPTLAANLGEMLRAVNDGSGRKTAVITNSSLLHREDVREDLLSADFVLAKLDAPSVEVFGKVNRPKEGVSFFEMVNGIRKFRRSYGGRLALQIMFVDENKGCAEELSRLAREIEPAEIQINTPLRSCAVKPLSKEELGEIVGKFPGFNVVSVYETERPVVNSLSDPETLARRGKY